MATTAAVATACVYVCVFVLQCLSPNGISGNSIDLISLSWNNMKAPKIKSTQRMSVLVRQVSYIMSFEIDSMRNQISANELMPDTFCIGFANEYKLTRFNEKGGNTMQLVGIVLNTTRPVGSWHSALNIYVACSLSACMHTGTCVWVCGCHANEYIRQH